MNGRPYLLSLALCSVAAASCGGDEPGGPAFDCDGSAEEGLLLGPECPGLALRVLPGVRIDGAWRGLGLDGPCSAAADGVTCPAGEAGHVTAVADGAIVHARFDALADTLVEGLLLEGPGSVEGARAWISNGFQSWSQSGPLSLGPPVDDAELVAALAARGDAEVVREGHELSWTYTLIGSDADAPALVAGARTADRFKPWVTAHRTDGGELRVQLGSGVTGERVAVAAGESLEGERFVVGGTDAPRTALSAYGTGLPSRRRDHPVPTEAGWNSWYDLWDAVDETAVRENAALAREILEPRVPPGTPLRIVVDDGWQRAWGDWQPNDRFPSGLDGLAADLRVEGFEMGVWLAPLLVHEEAPVAVDHADWLVDGPTYRHLKNGTMRVLDPTHPEAAAHLADVIATIVSWGYDLLKIDFLFAGTWEGERYEDVTGMQAYHRALEIIREAAGPDAVLLAVGAPALASLPHVDQWRVGGDIAIENFDVAWPFIPSQARSIGARVPFCLATLCDPDPVLLRTLPRDEVEVGAWVVALGGGALFLSDDLREVDAGRASWALDERRVALSLSAEPAMPSDVLPADSPDRLTSALVDHLGGRGGSSHVLPSRWELQDDTTLLINVGDEARDVDGTEVPGRSAVHLP